MRRRRTSDDIIIRELTEAEKLQNIANAETGGEDEEDTDPEDDVPFTTKLRAATRKVHNVSDHLVNAKLGIAMSDDKIWAEGLLVFYEIFKFLEGVLERQAPKNWHFKKMAAVIGDIKRTKAFEEDLQYYFGNNFLDTYQIRPSVASYIKHLQTLEEREPLRILAYVYHLYMGLLSGGQILKRKRELRKKIRRGFGEVLGWFGLRSNNVNASGAARSAKPGNAVTSFKIEGRTINDIKKEIAFTMNDIASDLSKDEKESLISESMFVFQRNNEVVGSIDRTGLIALKNLTSNPLVWLMAALTIGSVLIFVYFRNLPTESQMASSVADNLNDDLVGVVDSLGDTEFEVGADGFLQ